MFVSMYVDHGNGRILVSALPNLTTINVLYYIHIFIIIYIYIIIYISSYIYHHFRNYTFYSKNIARFGISRSQRWSYGRFFNQNSIKLRGRL